MGRYAGEASIRATIRLGRRGERARRGSARAPAAAALAALCAALGGGAPAQEPKPAPPAPPVQPPQAQPVTPAPKPAPPIDETDAAADLLRRRLGLKPVPPEAAPPGPDTGARAAAKGQDPPRPQEAAPLERLPQEPFGPPPPPRIDETDAAAEALRRLLPRAKPAEQAPVVRNLIGPPPPPAPDAAAAPVRAAVAKETSGAGVRGTFSVCDRVRHGDGASDNELIARLALDVGDAERDAVTARFSGRGFADLDGRREDDPFAGLDQSLGDTIEGRLLEGSVAAHRLPHLELCRLGRQFLDETPVTMSFDGLRVDSERFGGAKAWASAYGGVPVHEFEASARGDLVLGLAGGFSPWTGARVRGDVMDIRDDYLAVDQEDDVLAVSWWQAFDGASLRGEHTWVDGKPRDLVLRGQAAADALPVAVQASYRELLTTQRASTTEFDPFFEVALEYEPFRQVDVLLSRDLGEDVTIDVGAEVRRLDDASDEGQFNREFERVHVDGTWRDCGVDDLSVSLSGALWNTQGEDYRALSGDLEWRPDASLRVTFGSAYDLYRYDVFDDREREHVRSWYLRAGVRLATAVRADGAYDYERSDDAEYRVFRLGVTWTF